MKKILVPTDFSECATHATEVAASIAKKTGARLYILHVLDIPVYDRNDSFQSPLCTFQKFEFKESVNSNWIVSPQDLFE